MAQETSPINGQILTTLQAQNLAVAVPAAGNTTLLEVNVLGLKRLGVSVLSTVLFDAFIVEVRMHQSDTYATLTSGVTSTPAGQVVAASGTLATLGAATPGWVLLDVQGFHSVRIRASCAVSTGAVDVYASGTA